MIISLNSEKVIAEILLKAKAWPYGSDNFFKAVRAELIARNNLVTLLTDLLVGIPANYTVVFEATIGLIYLAAAKENKIRLIENPIIILNNFHNANYTTNTSMADIVKLSGDVKNNLAVYVTDVLTGNGNEWSIVSKSIDSLGCKPTETRCMFNFSPLKNINVRELFNYHMHKIPVLKEIIND